nr:PREDICTED: dynein assembly factor 5, axonemal [Bemisia tabaci]
MPPSDDTTETHVNKFLNSLTDQNKFVRKSVLSEMCEMVCSSTLSADTLENLSGQILKSVIRCFNDSAEVCREKSVLLAEALIKQSPVNEKYLMVIIPTLHQRLGDEKVAENSEEVRLLEINFLRLIVSKYGLHLPAYLSDIIDILCKSIIDPYPEVKIASCACASELSMVIPAHFHMQSESLISPLTQTLGHRQSKVRISAINAIGLVVKNGNNRSVEVVAGPLAERLFDQSPGVRKAVTLVVGDWLLNLRDRYSYFRFLIPLILTSLSDEIPEHQIEAAMLWDKIGQQYFTENEKELQEKLDYLPAKPDHYPQKLERPHLGCRVLVQREMSKFIPAIAKELEDWVDDVKVKSAQLLAVVLLHGEHSITMHLEKILPTMYRAIIDTDTRVSENVDRAAKTMGYFVPPETYCKLVLPLLEESHHAGHLRLLASLISTSPKDSLIPLIEEVTNLLSSSNVCHSREALYQFYLLEACRSILNVCEKNCSVISRQLFVAILSVLGLAANEEIREEALELLNSLSEICGFDNVAALYKQHIECVLESLKTSVESLSIQCPQRFIFEAILIHAGPVIGNFINLILEILEMAFSVDNDPEVVLKFLMIIARILSNWEETFAEVEDKAGAIEKLLDILKCQLIWRAGLSAEALRTAAVTCVLTALSVRPFSSSLPSKITPIVLSLIEDQAYKTRLYALSSICELVDMERESGSLTAETINKIYPEILKRLDDANDQVREKAANCISVLFQTPLPADYDMSSSKNHFEFIYKTLLIHLDDMDPKFQQIVLDVLKSVGSLEPNVLAEKLSVQNFRDKKILEDLRNFNSLTLNEQTSENPS